MSDPAVGRWADIGNGIAALVEPNAEWTARRADDAAPPARDITLDQLVLALKTKGVVTDADLETERLTR